MFTRRLWLVSFLCVMLVSIGGVNAAGFQPHEPFDPSKAQSLPLTPMAIESEGKFHKFQVEVAETEDEQHIGLMHRAELGKDRGMLFTYTRPSVIKFWMRNTFIPLDMLFIRGDAKIAYIAENVQPHDERGIGPDFPVVAELELPAGTVSHFKIKVGDILHHASFGNGLTP